MLLCLVCMMLCVPSFQRTTKGGVSRVVLFRWSNLHGALRWFLLVGFREAWFCLTSVRICSSVWVMRFWSKQYLFSNLLIAKDKDIHFSCSDTTPIVYGRDVCGFVGFRFSLSVYPASSLSHQVGDLYNNNCSLRCSITLSLIPHRPIDCIINCWHCPNKLLYNISNHVCLRYSPRYPHT